MMEWLNNANVIAGLIVAIFGIGGYIIGIAAYLKGKVSKSRVCQVLCVNSF
jgi:hypothetical protein